MLTDDIGLQADRDVHSVDTSCRAIGTLLRADCNFASRVHSNVEW